MEKYGSAAQQDNVPFYIDLHIHSNYSDGLLSPEQIVRTAKERRICAVSITDHDAIAGTAEAMRIGKEEGVKVIPGIEISVLYNDSEVHLLGYYIDQTSSAIHEYIQLLSDSRSERAQKIVDVLKKQGVNIPYELVLQKANGAPIGRPHIAQVMVEEGYVFSAYEAFQKFLGEKRSGDIPKFSLGIQQAVDIIKQAGGLAFWAHPATVQLGDEVLQALLRCGLDGIETIHPKHSAEQQAHYSEAARQFGLLESGGSDCHGGREGTLMLGTQNVPVEFLNRMKERRTSISMAS
jgi:3',5'-nucleoside bisphosphate phosphatase